MSDTEAERDLHAELVAQGKVDLEGHLLGTHTSANLLIVVLVVFVGSIFAGVGLFATHRITPLPSLIPEISVPSFDASLQMAGSRATFQCSGGRSINVQFGMQDIVLALSDGRTLTLPRILSTDGARYANPDGSFVFWSKGEAAWIDESGIRTYRDCATR